ncbi:MAG: zinc finger domain-containing protein [Candidatus Bathyarchaeota archaeon]|nr:zinc finger domain-containing protein [Candidatus Bathyarchaeota archaeon]
MSICISCGRKVAPDEKAVKMSCPNCGAITMWRCEKCRLFGRTYRCPACGFQGP